jgi:hypothetical protein
MQVSSVLRAVVGSTLAIAMFLGACKSDPGKKPQSAETVVEESEATPDTSGVESGQEGDDNDLALPVAVTATAPGPAARAALHAEANRILSRSKSSRYVHTSNIDESAGVFELDCSGFVDYAVARTAPAALEALRGNRKKRPLAKHYVELVSALAPGQSKGPWHRLTKASELEPGDIVAWLKPDDVVSKNTGHVMIVGGPVTASDGEVAVPILDSTSVAHGSGDSRSKTKATGLGRGTIHLLVGPNGEPVAYRWSNGRKAKPHTTTIALARIE